MAKVKRTQQWCSSCRAWVHSDEEPCPHGVTGKRQRSQGVDDGDDGGYA